MTRLSDHGLVADLIGYWRLNDAPGSATARDSSLWGNDGTLVGLDAATAWAAGGPEGGALSLREMGDVNVPDSASIDSITEAGDGRRLDPPDRPAGHDRFLRDGHLAPDRNPPYGQHYHLSVDDPKPAILFITTMTGGASM